jgi:hypothetical protein
MITLPQYILYMYTVQPNGFQVTPTSKMCLRGPGKLMSGKISTAELGDCGEGRRLVT